MRAAWLVGLGLALGVGYLVAAPVSAPPERLLADFETSLRGRTPGQAANARLCAGRLTGRWVGPGKTFSFNAALGGWTRDMGYRKAPVSFDGQLVTAWGGGVCQVSTTLYNAALLGGLQIVERHPHQFAPAYVPPGRDAAVAYKDVDLRLRNPYPWPIRIESGVTADRLWVRLVGRGEAPRLRVVSEVRDVRQPLTFANAKPTGRARVRSEGKPGFEVRVWRLRGQTRELISEDDYPAMHRMVEYVQ